MENQGTGEISFEFGERGSFFQQRPAGLQLFVHRGTFCQQGSGQGQRIFRGKTAVHGHGQNLGKASGIDAAGNSFGPEFLLPEGKDGAAQARSQRKGQNGQQKKARQQAKDRQGSIEGFAEGQKTAGKSGQGAAQTGIDFFKNGKKRD